MPILFNFHILLATFYTIFETNILIQCPVPVRVCCMFYVSQKPNIKWSSNGIKTDGELFWNICDFWEVKSTRDGARGGQETGGAPQGGRRAQAVWARPPVSWPPRTPFRVDSSSGKSQIFQNNSPSVFIPFVLHLILGFCET